MAEKFLKIPYLNPVRFFQQTVGKFHTELVPPFEQPSIYFQPYAYGDRFYVQFLMLDNGLSGQTVSLVDNEGTVYRLWNIIQIPGAPKYGNYFPYHCGGVMPSVTAAPEGIYFFKASISSPDGLIVLVSDPIYLSAAEDNELLITYANDDNNFDLIFDVTTPALTPEFSMRIVGGVRSADVVPGGKFEVFIDQEYSPVMLGATPFNTYKFTFGDGRGIPNHVADKLNRIFSLTDITITGDLISGEFVRAENAKLERQDTDGIPFAPWTIDLLKTDNDASEGVDYIDTGELPLTFDNTYVTWDSDLITFDQTTY